MAGRVLGVDACKAGWVGIALGDGPLRPYFATLIDDLVSAAALDGPLDVVAIDMPIGMPDRGRRKADTLARRIAGPRWSSVFITPVRATLEAEDYPAALTLNHQLTGEGISRQAYALRTKMLQVDRWVRQTSGQRIVEVHPEVCFVQLAGEHLTTSKATWAGVETRRNLLTRAGLTLTGPLGEAGAKAGVDDVLDATVAAWTARRVATGDAICIPDPPETFSDGIASAIWA